MALETITPLFIGGAGPLELGVLLLIAVLLFGANKIPKLARSTGEAMGEFQKGREEVEQELEEMREGPDVDGSEMSAEPPSDVEPATETETDTDADSSTSADQ